MEFLEVVTTVEFTFTQTLDGKRKRRTTSLECTTVSVLSDDIVEYDEYFQVMLSTADTGVILSPVNATIVILNNDCECMCQVFNSLLVPTISKLLHQIMQILIFIDLLILDFFRHFISSCEPCIKK